jgi:hypothetical protein
MGERANLETRSDNAVNLATSSDGSFWPLIRQFYESGNLCQRED